MRRTMNLGLLATSLLALTASSSAGIVAAAKPIALDRCPATAAYALQLVARLSVAGPQKHAFDDVKYDPAGVTVLGVRPLEFKAGMVDNRLTSLEARLPASGTYEAAFRRLYPAGQTECGDGECWWYLPNGDNAPSGVLKEAGLNGDDDEALFVCNYSLKS